MPSDTNIKQVAMRVLNKYKDTQSDLSSELVRETIAEDMSEEVSNWIRNLWQEDFEKPE
jgi:SOS response regulatory protein OraA/RecX